mmetsp:Transcript_121425/g.344030  ORF Transcript_121425/g.344030 Transcript_121425/m.344030 type:complete len:419 (-) Transcript_121425:146-1402(-)
MPASLIAMTYVKFAALAMLSWGPLEAAAASLATARGLAQAQTQASMSVSLSLRRNMHTLQKTEKMAYFGRVAVGSPPQEFVVVYDTGSGNLIVPQRSCTSRACMNHKRFDQNLSSTAEPMNCDGSDVPSGAETDEITITFGTGYISGHCMRDKICIGQACSKGAFIASTDESDQPFSSFTFDGVLGLGREVLAETPNFSMMSRLVGGSALRQPLFSVFLSDSDAETSEITFGDIKREHMASELFWVPVTGTSGYWEVTLDDITFNREQQGICKDCRVAVDTGTSQLAGPSALMEKLRTKLNVAADCSNFKQLPNLGFVVGGRILSLAPSDYVVRDDRGCGMRFMNIDIPPPNGPLLIFGIPFLQKFYTVYDTSTNRVGFAVAKHEGEEPIELLTVGPPAPAKGRSPTFLARASDEPSL